MRVHGCGTEATMKFRLGTSRARSRVVLMLTTFFCAMWGPSARTASPVTTGPDGNAETNVTVVDPSRVFDLADLPKRSESAPPNVVLMYVDDLGWTDLSGGNPNFGNGSDFYETPSMDSLADQGLSLTSCYMQPNCAPSRAALLSGQYSVRDSNGIYSVTGLNRGNGIPMLVGPDQNVDVPASTFMLPEMLQAAGYVTAHFGKYHIGGTGGEKSTLPQNQGFDFNFGGTAAGSPPTYFANKNSGTWKFPGGIGPALDPYALPYSDTYITKNIFPYQKDYTFSKLSSFLSGTTKHLTDAMADAVEEFIDSHVSGPKADQPFFIHYSHYAVHVPSYGRADLVSKYRSKPGGVRHNDPVYAAMIEQLDQTLARLIDNLSDPNGDNDSSDDISADTILIFVSDNGGDRRTTGVPLRGRKGMFTEGGIRVPMIVRWPGVISPGTVSDTVVHALDFYPTFADISGASLPAGHVLDGESFANVLTDFAHADRTRSNLYFHFPGYLDSRASPSTIMLSQRSDGNRYKFYYTYEDNRYELYNLTQDMGEKNNLLDSKAEFNTNLPLAEVMRQEMVDWLDELIVHPEDHYPKYRSTGKLVDPPGEIAGFFEPGE
jgi:arylsulfatase A-like enzyme